MFLEISSPANTLKHTYTHAHTHTQRCIDSSSSAGYRPNQGQGLPKSVLVCCCQPIGLSGYRRSPRHDQVKSGEHASLFSFRLTFFCRFRFVIVFFFHFICPSIFGFLPQFVVVVTVLCPVRRLVTVDRKTSTIADCGSIHLGSATRLIVHAIGVQKFTKYSESYMKGFCCFLSEYWLGKHEIFIFL